MFLLYEMKMAFAMVSISLLVLRLKYLTAYFSSSNPEKPSFFENLTTMAGETLAVRAIWETENS